MKIVPEVRPLAAGMNIVLIGPRGSGKTSVSRRLAAVTGRGLLSTDLLVSYESEGASIAALVERHGGDWRPFRELEYQVVVKAAALEGIIIDCGGGVVVDLDAAGEEIFSERKVAALKRHGQLVWLKGDAGRLAARIRGDESRPSLSRTNDAETIMRRREPFYRLAADHVVEIDGCRIPEIVERVGTVLGL
ncbi:MAG: shikimate kinase [Magnetococcales bacterium]|nr:shikimate kinase [Magnetococcales bacterium]MBF0157016.1 shikimate kinase [Magnetococcales bacterium]